MTFEEKIEQAAKAARNRRYLAVPLGIWFIIEYLQLMASTHNVILSLLRTPMMLVTAVLLLYLVYRQRMQFFPTEFSRRQGIFYSLELMFYAGMLEAFFCLILNKWIMPNNLAEMHDGIIAQYEEVGQMLNASPFTSLKEMFDQTLKALKEAPVETPINAAINLLSTDVLYGCILGVFNGLVLKRKPKATEEVQNNQ